MEISGAGSVGGGGVKVLMVEDDRKYARMVGEYLGPFGFEVEAVHTGPEGVERALAGPGGGGGGGGGWGVVVLDLMLPGMDGFAVLGKIREKSRVPVLMLTARGEETDRIVGLELGADDYLPKTASVRELLARLRALVRRSPPAPSHGAAAAGGAAAEELLVGGVRVVPEARRAWVNGTLLTLTPVEFDLLVVLARAKGRVRTRDQLLDEIRDREYEVFDRSIDVHVSALRRKLGDDPRKPKLIHTIRTVGYMMDPGYGGEA